MSEYPYVTLAQSIRLNGERHRANGDRYLAEGRADYAAGSYRKAERNFALARRLNDIFEMPAVFE